MLDFKVDNRNIYTKIEKRILNCHLLIFYFFKFLYLDNEK